MSLTAQIAIAMTDREEKSALFSTVAWTAHIMDKVLGWNDTPLKGGRKVAIRMARETYGYRIDASGVPILDAKGQRVKRSAIFNRLALVDKLCAYVVKHDAEWVETIHAAATDPEKTDNQRLKATTSEIEQFAASLAAKAKGETIDALAYFLEHNVAKVDATPSEDEDGKSPTEQLSDPSDNASDGGDEPRQIGFGEVMAWMAQNKGTLTIEQATAIAEAASEIIALRQAEEAEAVAEAA